VDSRRASQIVGTASLVLLVLGAAMYAINSPNRPLTIGLLVGGGLLVVVYALMNLQVIREFSRKRSSRYGANLAVVVVLFSCIVVIVQALSARHNYRYDVTANKRFSLAEQTTSVLRSLDKDLWVWGFYSQGSDDRLRAEELLSQYAHHTPHFRYELIDPDRNPMRASDLGVKDYGTVVLQYGARREQITDMNEETLTNAIVRVTRSESKTLYFTTGHGEKELDDHDPGGCSDMSDALRKGNYTVKGLSLFDEPAVPDDCDVLIVAGPKTDYFDSETKKISDYLEHGGNAVFMLDARVDAPNLEELLGQYGVGVDNDVIIDPYSRILGGDYTVPVVADYPRHPITRNLDLATFFPMARSVKIDEPQSTGTSAQYLARTGKSAWGETDLEGVSKGQAVRDDADIPPPVPLALIASKPSTSVDGGASGESSIVLFGDSEFVANSYFQSAGNADLFLNTVNFLAEEKDLIAIRAKQGMGDRLFLTANQGRLIFLLCVVLLPLSVIGVGTSVFVRRRKQG
jgi:ABC-type uncharacterized transport system involved in gliding motility auxiliary subunit